MRYISLWDVAVGCAAVVMVTNCACKVVEKMSRTAERTKKDCEVTIRTVDRKKKSSKK